MKGHRQDHEVLFAIPCNSIIISKLSAFKERHVLYDVCSLLSRIVTRLRKSRRGSLRGDETRLQNVASDDNAEAERGDAGLTVLTSGRF